MGFSCGACNEGATIGMAAAFCIMAAVGMLRDRRVGAYGRCGFAGVALGGLFPYLPPPGCTRGLAMIWERVKF